MAIDKFYEDYNAIWQNKDKLSPQEFKVALDNVRFEYPFMDTVLLSKKDGVERDRAYAYSVLGRIAPGDVTAISGGADLSPEIIDKFYSSKGVIDKWQEDDYMKFMGGVVSIGTTLAIPDKTTQQDWTLAKNTYTAMNETIGQQFGADWTDKRDVYYNLPDDTTKNEYLKLHPELTQAMDMQAYLVANNPILAAYYDGLRNISDYYNAQFQRDVKNKIGANWYDLLKEKQAIFGDPERKAFDKAHNMTALSKQYTALKKQWDALIMQKITDYGNVLPVGQPSQIQQLDPNNLSTGQAGILKALEPKPVVQWETIAPLISASLEDAITRYLQDGRPFTSAEESALGRAASYYKIDIQTLLQAANVKFTDSQRP